ncbi:SoxR reducing system RseC family protein [bacterium SCSIO 12696]|nr:SoxR reducing system RseC family protein [bacterium SCSIO 12696]
MLEETVTINAVESDCLWVEADAKSACGSCAARTGCGQKVLAKLMAKPNLLRVPLPAEWQNRSHAFQVGQQVTVGVPEEALITGSLLLYLLPLMGLFVGGGIAQFAAAGEFIIALSCLAGLVVGAVAVRLYALRKNNLKRYSPVLLN